MRRSYVSYLLTGLFFASVCGAEFQVNMHTTYDQKNAAIAMDNAGNFVVVWSSYLQDGSSNGLFARLFDPNCGQLGEEFQINATSSGNQAEPAVAMDAAAGFVVSWQGAGFDRGGPGGYFRPAVRPERRPCRRRVPRQQLYGRPAAFAQYGNE